MESTRQSKLSRLLQKELADIFQRESRNLFNGSFITVTEVVITKDLSIAKVYLSFLGVTEKEALLNTIKEHTNKIRGLLGNRIKNQVRAIPTLSFYVDGTLDYLDNINSLLKK